MVSRTRTVLIDDLDEQEIREGGGRTVTFAVGTSSFEIDLSDDNLGKLYDALKPFTDKARRVGSRAGSQARKEGGSTSSPARVDKEQLQAMRQWAQENGYKVSNRGRISGDVQSAYHAAH